MSQVHGSPVPKTYKNLCDKIRRANTVLARGETELSEEMEFSVSLDKNFIFRFHIYFSAGFGSYFLVSDT